MEAHELLGILIQLLKFWQINRIPFVNILMSIQVERPHRFAAPMGPPKLSIVDYLLCQYVLRTNLSIIKAFPNVEADWKKDFDDINCFLVWSSCSYRHNYIVILIQYKTSAKST